MTRSRVLTEANTREAKDRIRRLFLFLEERAKLDSPVERTIDPEEWQLRLSDLPDHPGVTGSMVDQDEERADVLLEVRRPVETPCPAPGPNVEAWLEPGWEKVDVEAAMVSAETQDARVELFDDEPHRATSFALWCNLREEWRKAELPTRRVIATYEHLFALRARLQRESERYRVLLGDGWLLLERGEERIAHPVLLQELDLEFDERLPSLRLRAARPAPELNTALLGLLGEVDGASIARARELVEKEGASLCDRPGVRELVTKVANLLFPNAQIVRGLDHRPSERPIFAEAPIVFLGSRAGTIPLAAHRFIEALDDMEELPAPLVDVVLDRADAEEMSDTEPLFTLPANREQEEILRRLERHGSVVVQGPPGTGKTHTIANLIGHLLAEGKTVLVTSHTAKALRVVRDKVVPELEPLCVAFLESDLAGREQLESSVNGIVARLSLPAADDRSIAEASLDRGRLAADLRHAEKALDRALRSEAEAIAVGDAAFLPREAAAIISEGRGRDDWIPAPIEPGTVLPLTVSEVHELYRLQEVLSADDDAELAPDLPAPEVMVEPETYARLVEQIRALERSGGEEVAGFFDRSTTAVEVRSAVERASKSLEWLTSEPWLVRCLEESSRGGAFLASWDELRRLIGETLDAYETFHPLNLRHELALPEDLDPDAALDIVDEIIEHLSQGGRLGWLARLKKGRWTGLVERASIDGQPPRSVADFETIRAGYALRAAKQRLIRRWRKQLVPYGAPDLPEHIGTWPELLEPFEQKIARAKLWLSGEWRRVEEELAGAGLSWEAVDSRLAEEHRHNAVTRARLTLARVLKPGLAALRKKERLEELRVWERRLLDRLARVRQLAGRALEEAARARDVHRYAEAYERLVELRKKKIARARRRRLLDRVHAVAPGWGAALSAWTSPHEGPQPPGDPERAWRYAQLARALDARHSVDLDRLQREITELRDRLHQKTADLVSRRAWTKQVERTSAAARRNLTGWLDYQKQIGKGTGKRAPMLQRKALELLAECKDSVPVWIMPLSKVIESYDLARTRFDVVIIDEASQCDVNGLFAFGLARQIVVVGDDQQVSPLAVGQKLDPIQRLIDLHLDDIPNKELFTSRLSIYDLARQSQPAVRLREHFRCVPEIIEFSSRLAYDGEIQALREGASASVKPPVIEHNVSGVCDERNVNTREAVEVAALIAACTEQPEYADATMGVISLLGEEQWALIERFLHAWLEPQEIERRRLLCGAAPHFQGDERDVIFVSMVWSPTGDPLKLNDNPEFKKRLNVAASRARDQMWVVHSLNPDTDLKPLDLRRRLIEHARNPRGLLEPGSEHSWIRSDAARTISEALTERGFRVKPDWEVGAYRIDLVVEGPLGRVAIECGWDRPRSSLERAQDRARWQQLERLGWRFIRVRGSELELNPAATIDAVVRRLEELEITPLGPDDRDSERPTGILHERVTLRAAELRQSIWERFGEQETLEQARRPRSGLRARRARSSPPTGPGLRRGRTSVGSDHEKISPV